MSRNWLALLFSTSLLFACGSSTPEAEAPTDGDADTDGSPTTEDSDNPGGGVIMRDADGDGIPDDKEKSDCESKNETQCKINMDCAWTDAGTCVKAKGGM